MNSILIFAILLISSDLAVGQEKVHVAVYYESLCPDSVRFIGSQLVPDYQHFADLIDLEFVPFGKSSSLLRADGVDFACQHGPNECEGNKIQSCALVAAPSRESQMMFVACQMSYSAESSGQNCAEATGIPFQAVQDCVKSDHGVQLQLAAERKTQDVAYPNSMLRFVPTIVYNHRFDQGKQNRSLRDFRSVVCDELRAASYQLPQICLI